jgi:hypothetical protein
MESEKIEQDTVQIKLVDVQITDENIALNVIISFLSLAQKRGAFSFDESAKIWECIQQFQKPPPVGESINM